MLQPCSSRNRCLRQYRLLQSWQWTPVTRGVSIKVLQLGSEHCCSCVRTVGLGEGFEAELRFCCSRFRRAHSPACVHECAVSVRWSRQNLLGDCQCTSFARWKTDDAYPLQLSHRNGKKSSWRQNGIWQCAPMRSTSPVDILV